VQAHRIETTIAAGGTLTVTGLPLPEGAGVEVIILVREPPMAAPKEKYPLRGKPYRYDDPTEPVAVDDREAGR
jgi:hypothetical protein